MWPSLWRPNQWFHKLLFSTYNIEIYNYYLVIILMKNIHWYYIPHGFSYYPAIYLLMFFLGIILLSKSFGRLFSINNKDENKDLWRGLLNLIGFLFYNNFTICLQYF